MSQHGWWERDPTDLLADACRHAAEVLPPRLTKKGNRSEWPLESELEKKIIEGLVELGVPSEHIGARQNRIDADWDPLPHGIDLYIWSEPGRTFALIAELKLEEIQQSQWDLYKLLAGRKLPGNPAACLVNAAYATKWLSNPPCSELFPERSGTVVDVDSRALFERNQSQWIKDLKASAARPLTVPTTVRARAIAAGISLKDYPRLELMAAEVNAHDETAIRLQDGWPV